LLRKLLPLELNEKILKIDNISNVDRVARLVGTVNYPKAEKRQRGQITAMAHVAIDYSHKHNTGELITAIIKACETRGILFEERRKKRQFVANKNTEWPTAKQVFYLCTQIKDRAMADSNDWYVYNVMFPLISAIHQEHDPLTLEEAGDAFLEAVSGGGRFGRDGRTWKYFWRQWTSHRPLLDRRGTRTLRSLYRVCLDAGIKFPWNPVDWSDEFDRQQEALQTVTLINEQDAEILRWDDSLNIRERG
jgi:hypothetical protein